MQITSRLLSLFNTIVVFFIRVPQIAKIISSRSVFGLSYFGNNLEVTFPQYSVRNASNDSWLWDLRKNAHFYLYWKPFYCSSVPCCSLLVFQVQRTELWAKQESDENHVSCFNACLWIFYLSACAQFYARNFNLAAIGCL